MGITPNELYKSHSWFSRYGIALVFWGRLIPGIRTLISVPAGIELMPLTPFIFWTTAGSLLWIIFLTVSGILLGESYSAVEIWIEPFSKGVKFILALSIFIIFVWLCIRSFFPRK